MRVLDKSTLRVFSANPRDIGGEKHFYSKLPDAQVLERWFSSIERRAAKVYNRLEAASDCAVLDEADRISLCLLISSVFTRSKEMRASIAQQTELLLNLIAKQLGVTDWTVKLNPDGELGYHVNVFSLIPEFARLILHLGMTVLRNETRLPFTTSDNPVVRWNMRPPQPSGGGRLGLANEGIQLYFPLSPNLCLLAYDLRAYRFPSTTSVDLPALVLLERSLQLEQSFRHVIGLPSESFSHELEALRDDPTLGNPKRKRFETG